MRRGFTLVEILVSLSLTALLVGIVSSLSFTYFRNQQLQAAAESVAVEIRRAQSEAFAQTDDAAHGVKVFTDRSVRFTGSSYATRDTSKDMTTEFPGTYDLIGDDEIVFAAASLAPSAAAALSLDNDRRRIDVVVSTYGIVDLTAVDL